MSSDGILVVYLKEYYTNMWEPEEENNPAEPLEEEPAVHIEGLTEVYPFDIVTYTLTGADAGKWSINNNKAKILKAQGNTVEVQVLVSRAKTGDNFILSCGNVELKVDILPL